MIYMKTQGSHGSIGSFFKFEKQASDTDILMYRLVPSTKAEYDYWKQAQDLIKLVENGEFNTALGIYFNALYRRATNMPDTWYTSNGHWEDGTPRTKKQIQNSISAIEIDVHYVMAYEGKDGFIDLADGFEDTLLKDLFIIEKNYQTNKNSEYRRIIAIFKIQEYIEEKYKDQDAPILKLLTEIRTMRLQQHPPIDLTGAQIGQGI